MTVKRLFACLSAAIVAPPAVLAVAPSASAAPCPSVEVVFARGTGGLGLGGTGGAFVKALRNRVRGRSLGVYSVNYPASFDFTKSAAAGAADVGAHVYAMAVGCPDTQLVLSGISQGAGVIDLVTIDHPGPIGKFNPTPLLPQLADHVAAVAVFGNPLRTMPGGGPLTHLSSTYGARTIDLCAKEDPFCTGKLNILAHFSYDENGMTEQAADFTAEQLVFTGRRGHQRGL